MESAARRRTRGKAAAAGGAVLLACVVLILCTGDENDPLEVLWLLGLWTSGPIAWCFLLFLPFEMAFAASVLWILYFAAVAYTRLGLVHWGYHLTLCSVWCLVGTWTSGIAGNMLT